MADEEPVIRRMRWQIVLTVVGVAVLGSLLVNLALSRTTMLVPDHGGTYVEGIAGRPRFINPILWQNEAERDLVALIFSGLTSANDRGEVVPDLARSWTISDDGLSYTFSLRRDARWHDGTPVTAADVVFTVRLVQDLSYTTHPELAMLWRTVKVSAPDERTVRFTLEQPFAPFLDYTTLGLLPSHLLKGVSIDDLAAHPFNQQPVGTGPFHLVELDDEHAALEPVAADGRRRPYLGRLEFRFYPDYHTVFGAYQRDEVQGISRLLPEDLPEVAADEDLNLYSAPLPSLTIVILNLNKPFFEDARVRRALLLALDRQVLVDQVLEGQGVVADSPLPPSSWAHEATLSTGTRDLQEAKRLLDDAGWTDPDGDGLRARGPLEFEFQLVTNDDPRRAQLVELIAQAWAQIGVRAHPKVVSPVDLSQDYLRYRRFDAVLYGLSFPTHDPDPYPLWHSSQTNGEGQNYGGFANEEVDALLEEARLTTDQPTRAAMYRRFQVMFAKEVPALPLFYDVYHYAVSKTVHNVQLGPGLLDPSERFRNIADWYIRTRRVVVNQSR